MDGDGANHTQVLVKLLDSNDNDPVFEMEQIEAYVDENHPTHQPFFVVQAYDKDRGKVNFIKISNFNKLLSASSQF